jgi:hypothetical protein
MRSTRAAVLVIIGACAIAAPARADVQFSMRDGRVSIVAKDATVAEILAEWARVGQTRVVNREVMARERVTIELKDVSEEQALAVLLRHASGYIAAPRASALPDASRFDRIFVMPSSVARGAIPVRPPAADADPDPPDDAPDSTAADGAPVGQAASDQTAASQAGVDQATRDQAAANAAPPDQSAAARTEEQALAERARANRARAYQGQGYGGAEQNAQVTYQASSDSASQDQALANRMLTRPTPPARPLASGQMSARRTAESPRDPRIVAPPPAADAVDVNQGQPLPEAPVAIPTVDPQAQAAFKQRQATETVDPRTFHFEMPPPAVVAPAGVPGATKPGVATPSPTKPGGPGQ